MPAEHRVTYTVEEANALVPEVRAILLQVAVDQRRLLDAHAALHAAMDDGGGLQPGAPLMDEATVAGIEDGIRALLTHLADRGIQVRDLSTGLVDFPAVRDARPVWLCWRLSDESVAHWHGTDEGYASRRRW
jgi:hypothetical protein